MAYRVLGTNFCGVHDFADEVSLFLTREGRVYVHAWSPRRWEKLAGARPLSRPDFVRAWRAAGPPAVDLRDCLPEE